LVPKRECPCGGTGRRARLKIEFRKECWFDSGQGHHASPFGLRVAQPAKLERSASEDGRARADRSPHIFQLPNNNSVSSDAPHEAGHDGRANTKTFPAARMRPGAASSLPPKVRGRREDRVPIAPMGPVQQKKHGVGPQVNRSSAGLPCASGLRLIARSPRCTGLFSHRRLAGVSGPSGPTSPVSQDLIPASGDQDHTPSPSVSAAFVNCANTSIASPPNVRDDRDPPLLKRVRTARTIRLMRASDKAKYFCRKDWTNRFLRNDAICPSGQIIAAGKPCHEPYIRHEDAWREWVAQSRC
jgi:hypothetical protein